MELKISEINMNCKAQDRELAGFLFDKLKCEDIIIFTEIVTGTMAVNFLNQFNNDFRLYVSHKNKNDKGNGNQIVIAVKKKISVLTQMEFCSRMEKHPDFLQLTVEIEGKEYYIIGVRILACYDYTDRLPYFACFNYYLQTLKDKNVIVLGDFNNGFVRSDIGYYKNKNNFCYNYRLIEILLGNNFKMITPKNKYSWGLQYDGEKFQYGYVADDHLILSRHLNEKVKIDYDWSFADENKNIYCKKIPNGFPDHAILRAKINL